MANLIDKLTILKFDFLTRFFGFLTDFQFFDSSIFVNIILNRKIYLIPPVQDQKNIGTEITVSRGASKEHSNRIRIPFASSTPSTHGQPTLPSRYLILESFDTGGRYKDDKNLGGTEKERQG